MSFGFFLNFYISNISIHIFPKLFGCRLKTVRKVNDNDTVLKFAVENSIVNV